MCTVECFFFLIILQIAWCGVLLVEPNRWNSQYFTEPKYTISVFTRVYLFMSVGWLIIPVDPSPLCHLTSAESVSKITPPTRCFCFQWTWCVWSLPVEVSTILHFLGLSWVLLPVKNYAALKIVPPKWEMRVLLLRFCRELKFVLFWYIEVSKHAAGWTVEEQVAVFH